MLILPLLITLYYSVFAPHKAAKHKKKVQTELVIKTKQLSADESRRYQYFWLEALRQDGMENYTEAFELYRHCLEINPDAAECHFKLAFFDSAMGRDSLAQKHYERALELDPKNEEFAMSLGSFYLSKNMVDKGAEAFERLIELAPDRIEYLDMLVRIYQHLKDYPKMLSALNRMETIDGQSEDLTLSKMQVYSYMGDEKGAYKELMSLVKSHPNDLNYKVMMGNWLLGNSKKPEALKTYLEVIKEEPDNAQAQMALMDYYRADGNMEEADKLLFAMLENPRTESSTRIALMRQVITDNEKSNSDSTRVLGIFNRILSMPQKTSEIAEMKAIYMSLKQMPSDSIKATLRQVIDINPENIEARLQLIDLMWRDSIDANVIKECEKAIDYVPEAPSLYYFLGLAKYINNDNEGALAALQKGATFIDDQTPADQASRMYSIMGDILHGMDKAEEAYAAYDRCLEYNPEEISCLNNYAYYLSEEGKELKKAEQMSYKTIKAEPENGTYLDTYAWILYKQERYEEAKIYIDQVMIVDSASLSATIYDHAGDIYVKTGKKQEALDFWQKALHFNPEDAVEIRKKIESIAPSRPPRGEEKK